jgi:hypothetical protein
MTISLKTSVRTLVEFVLREGDLFGGGFQEPDRALLGSRGHRRLQKSRPTGYQAEVAIRHLVETSDLSLEIFGRIDSIFSLDQPITLEEIKTTTQDLPLVTGDNPLHWGQTQCYAYMYARQHRLTEIHVQRHLSGPEDLRDEVDDDRIRAKGTSSWQKKPSSSLLCLNSPWLG